MWDRIIDGISTKAGGLAEYMDMGLDKIVTTFVEVEVLFYFFCVHSKHKKQSHPQTVRNKEEVMELWE